MLTASGVEVAARTLLNETSANFWTALDMTEWLKLAAYDISNRTFCVEDTDTITLTSSVREYSPGKAYLKIQNALYVNEFISLTRMSNIMQGRQSAVLTGPPEYFFDFASKFWISPAPTLSEAGHTITLMLAIETSDITKIPSRYSLSAALFVVAMGYLKERNNARATQVFSWYISTLQSDVQNIINPKINPPVLDSYSLQQSAPVAPTQPTSGQ